VFFQTFPASSFVITVKRPFYSTSELQEQLQKDLSPATITRYIPQDSLLVSVPSSFVEDFKTKILNHPKILRVMPFESYHKVQDRLLTTALQFQHGLSTPLFFHLQPP